MAWITKNSMNFLQKLCVNVLKCGEVPAHVAFIMDGNRRFAKKNQVDKINGHAKGFDKLSETLQWCLELGITEVTVYAFSIENFKRSPEEVEDLMNLARNKFSKLETEWEMLNKQGVRIRIIGNWSLVPDDIVKMISEAELMTKDNNKCFLNVAFAYTARDEVVHAVNTVANGVNDGLINVEDISSELLSHCLHTRLSPNPDLLIRTSGETRLSDFLLYQTSFSYLYFTDVLWPDFTAWDLLLAIFHYQRSYAKLKEARDQQKLQNNNVSGDSVNHNSGLTKNAEKFLELVDNRHWENIRKIVSS